MWIWSGPWSSIFLDALFSIYLFPGDYLQKSLMENLIIVALFKEHEILKQKQTERC